MRSLSLGVILAIALVGYETLGQTLPPILDPEAVVSIPDLGTMQGLSWFTSTTLRKFYVFHGIPYAKDTSGDKRFKVMLLAFSK